MLFTNVRFLLFFTALHIIGQISSQNKPVVQSPRWGMRSQHSVHSTVKRDTLQSRAWIEGFIHERRTQSDWNDSFQLVEAVVNDAPGFERVSYRLHDKVKLHFPDGSKVIVRCHSAHLNGEVGDVVVAMDNEGRVYVNFSHICGGMIRFYDSAVSIDGEGKVEMPLDSDTFFRKFRCDTDDEGWEFWGETKQQ